MRDQDKGMQLLLFLARQARDEARRCRRARERFGNETDFFEGMRVQAWNTLQIAKLIYFEQEGC